MQFINFIKKWYWQIFAILFFILFLGKGCTSTKITKSTAIVETSLDSMASTIDSLRTRLSSLEENSISAKETRDIMEQVMFDFLIYEDDLDHGTISKSEIKNKIQLND